MSPKSLGTENVRVLAPYAKTIIVASRSKERLANSFHNAWIFADWLPFRAAEAVKEVLKETPTANIKIVALDLGSGDSIRSAAAEILAFDIPIHVSDWSNMFIFSVADLLPQVLINNAAVPQTTTVARTKEGFETQFGSNHLGHFLFTYLVQPALIRGSTASDPARVVNVSSLAANWGGEIRFDDPNYTLRPEEYERYSAYAKSKTANISFAVGLAKRLGPKGVLAYSIHPGGNSNAQS